MVLKVTKGKTILLLVALVSIALNLYTFSLAYPQTFVINSGCCATVPLAKDFSAYYTAAWRLLHDPSNVYTKGFLADGETQILPQPEQFKYLPIFLVFIVPLTLLNYQSALTAFDIIQLLLLPLMAWLVYKLLDKDRTSTLVIALVFIVALLQPSPTPNWGLSVSYFWQWEEGQDKVLNTIILLLAFYFGQTKKPYLSGIFLALGSFDLRFFVLSIPLFLLYNKMQLKKALAALLISLGVFTSPLLIGTMGSGFITMQFSTGLQTLFDYYVLIPLLTLVAIMAVKWKELRELSKDIRFRLESFMTK
ncbi:MAG TPA: hypothetical protein VED00_00395 [archaeon]|nr:hypothetical protein [archaeon]